MIRTDQLRKDYGDFVAVRNVTLEIQKGDVFALIGPNGAGKTTLLKMLAGLLTPSYGQIFINDMLIQRHERSYYQFLGFMPDNYALYDDLTVWEYLDFFASCHMLKGEAKQTRIAQVLTAVQLEIKRDQLVHGLSKGMKQRLLLAKTLLHEPMVLLLDEPAAGLDPKARIELREIIKLLQRQGKTIVVSSHILSELADFCNCYGIMEKGMFVKLGRFDEEDNQAAPESVYRTVVLEVLHEPEQLLNLLNTLSGRIVEHKDNKVLFEQQGNREDLVKLNQTLVKQGIPLITFYEKRENIEDLFMKYSRHEVS